MQGFEQKNSRLLQTLQKLYSRITLRDVKRRIDINEQRCSAMPGCDLKSALHSHIEILIDSPRDDVNLHGKFSGQKLHAEADSKRTHQFVPDSNFSGKTRLSGYFKSSRAQGAAKGHVSEQLAQSTWEHLHLSIKYAHDGNTQLANLHADIADNAFRELAHFMPEEEYLDFSDEITGRLFELANHNPDNS